MKIGILGGGQLGRMLALAGIPLGLEFRFLDPSGEAVRGLGELTDDLQQFARGLDAVTYEFENVPVDSVRWLEERLPVWPNSRALEVSQDRLLEKQFLQRLGIPTAPFNTGVFPGLAKTRRLGYDGKGQRRVTSADQVGENEIVEEYVPFERELSLLAVRSKSGEVKSWPLIETTQRDGILVKARAPVEGVPPDYAVRVLEELDYVGVLALELFEHEGGYLANEMAPRVHNSGHWTLEGSFTSQFENHLRAGLGWPLGETEMRCPATCYNLIGRQADPGSFPGAHFHWYGKSVKPGRKVGHVTALEGRVIEELEVAHARSAS